MQMEHKYLQTTGTRKWKEDKVPQVVALYFFVFFLKVPICKYFTSQGLQNRLCAWSLSYTPQNYACFILSLLA